MQRQFHALSQEVLRTDVAGMPLEWIDYRVRGHACTTAARLRTPADPPLYRLRGGYSAKSGVRSIIEVNSIIATQGDTRTLERNRDRYTPPLNNRTLFRRDANLCMYCGTALLARASSRATTSRRSAAAGGTRGLTSSRHAGAATTTRAVAHPKKRGAARRRAVHTDVRRVHLSEGPQGARGPDAVSAHAFPAHEPAARATARCASGGQRRRGAVNARERSSVRVVLARRLPISRPRSGSIQCAAPRSRRDKSRRRRDAQHRGFADAFRVGPARPNADALRAQVSSRASS